MRKRTRRNSKRRERHLLHQKKGSRKVSHDIRDQVLTRDGHQCQHCGTPGSSRNRLTMHHKIYRRHGGPATVDNLITLCESCHHDYHQKMG